MANAGLPSRSSGRPRTCDQTEGVTRQKTVESTAMTATAVADLENAWRLGVNPGGAVLGGPVAADDVPGVIRHYGRLVTDKDEWTS